MAQYKISLDKDVCIGTLACAAEAPKFWREGDDGFAELIGGTFNEESDKWERVIEETELPKNRDAEAGCPVEAILIEKL